MSEATAKAFITDAEGSTSAEDVRDAIGTIYTDLSGSSAFVGAVVIKSADQTGVVNSAKITWETAIVDTDSFFDDANDQFVIPVGIGDNRWYEWKVHAEFAATSGDNSLNPVVTSAKTNVTDTPVRIGRGDDAATGFLARDGSLLLNLDEGDTVSVTAIGDASFTVRDDGAFMSIHDLGPAA